MAPPKKTFNISCTVQLNNYSQAIAQLLFIGFYSQLWLSQYDHIILWYSSSIFYLVLCFSLLSPGHLFGNMTHGLFVRLFPCSSFSFSLFFLIRSLLFFSSFFCYLMYFVSSFSHSLRKRIPTTWNLLSTESNVTDALWKAASSPRQF